MPTVSDIQTTALSNLRHIDALLDIGPDWNYLTPVGNTVLYTFSVASGNEAEFSGQQAFSAVQQANALKAFNYLGQLTGINFVSTNDGQAAQIHLCNIDIAGTTTTGLCSWSSSLSYLPGTEELVEYSANAYVYLDNAEWAARNASLTPGGYGYETLLHELGHALGLKHSFEGDIRLPDAEDSTVNTLMSYRDSGGPHATYSPYDIAALNWIYGGDGLRGALGINSTTGARFITGTNGADTLIGTPFNDTLEGDGGNDMINGGNGIDTVVFRGSRDAYTFTTLSDGSLLATNVGGSDGTDTLISIETIRFSNGTYQSAQVVDTTPPPPPTMSVTKNASGYVVGDSAFVVGIAEANAKVNVYTSSGLVGSAQADGRGFWSLSTTPFADGLNYQIFAKATDPSGNVSASSANISFNVDSHAPVAPTASFSLASGSNQPTFSGTGEAGTTLQLFNGNNVLGVTTVAANGTWSVNPNPLANASYDVTVVSTDKADNATNAANHLLFQVASTTNMVGTSGDDTLLGTPGNNNIDGLGGTDTMVYSGGRVNYDITKQLGGYVVTAKSGTDGTDVLVNIESLKFSDATLSVEYESVVQALYVAYFGRAADFNGLANFQSQLAGLHAPHDFAGVSAAYSANAGMRALIDSFGTSAESAALYSGDTSTFVTSIYKNILNRDPDASGKAFWVDAIDHGGLSKANASLSIMAGALANTSSQGKLDGQLVNNKTMIASDFSLAIDTSSEISAYSGDAAAATVRSMLSSVTTGTDLAAFQATVQSTLASLVTKQGATSAAAADIAHPADMADGGISLVGAPPANETYLLG